MYKHKHDLLLELTIEYLWRVRSKGRAHAKTGVIFVQFLLSLRNKCVYFTWAPYSPKYTLPFFVVGWKGSFYRIFTDNESVTIQPLCLHLSLQATHTSNSNYPSKVLTTIIRVTCCEKQYRAVPGRLTLTWGQKWRFAEKELQRKPWLNSEAMNSLNESKRLEWVLSHHTQMLANPVKEFKL